MSPHIHVYICTLFMPVVVNASKKKNRIVNYLFIFAEVQVPFPEPDNIIVLADSQPARSSIIALWA